MTSEPNGSPVRFEGHVAHLARDWSMAIAAAAPSPPRRIDRYSIGAVPGIDGPGPHLGEVHPDGDELLYVVSGTMEVILDDGDEHTIGTETTVELRAGDAHVVPRGVWHRVEALRNVGPWRPPGAVRPGRLRPVAPDVAGPRARTVKA